MQQTDSLQDRVGGEFETFLDTLRSETTRTSYHDWANLMVGDPNAFIQLARTDRLAAEKVLIDFTVKHRQSVSGTTLRNYRAAVKSFLNYYDVPLSWRKIKGAAPPARSVASDRAPEEAELRRMWEVADPRERLAMSMLVSLGGRRGAFWFPSVKGGWNHMKLRDVVELDDGTAKVTVYPGEPEQYPTLISPEAVQQLKLTLELRERAGEKIGPESPAMRNAWQSEYRGVERPKGWHPEEAEPLKAESVTAMFKRLKKKVGITTTSRNGGFKASHGFRKFYKSNFPACPIHGDMEADALMGHKESYDKLPFEHLRERYRIAIPHLVIDEKFRLKEEIKVVKEKDDQYHLRLEHDYLMTDKKLQTANERIDSLEGALKTVAEELHTIRAVRERELQERQPKTKAGQ